MGSWGVWIGAKRFMKVLGGISDTRSLCCVIYGFVRVGGLQMCTRSAFDTMVYQSHLHEVNTCVV